MIYITITNGLRGYFAVMVEQFEDGFIEPIQSSPISCKNYKEAVQDAEAWARAEELELRI